MELSERSKRTIFRGNLVDLQRRERAILFQTLRKHFASLTPSNIHLLSRRSDNRRKFSRKCKNRQSRQWLSERWKNSSVRKIICLEAAYYERITSLHAKSCTTYLHPSRFGVHKERRKKETGLGEGGEKRKRKRKKKEWKEKSVAFPQSGRHTYFTSPALSLFPCLTVNLTLLWLASGVSFSFLLVRRDIPARFSSLPVHRPRFPPSECKNKKVGRLIVRRWDCDSKA